MKANFLVAGVQKAGTTALHTFLTMHPKIFMPCQKELHFFDNEADIDWLNPDYMIYDQYFHLPDWIIARGEATPAYTFWPRSIERIRAYDDNMRLIMVLRNPVDRAFSHWKMEVTRGQEKLSFSSAIREGRQRISYYSLPDERFRTFSYVERGIYVPQIQRLLDCFPRDQILFITTDMLKRNFRGLLDRICDFLKVPCFSIYPKNRFIRGVTAKHNLPQMSRDDRSYLSSIYKHDIAEAGCMTNLDFSNWLLN